MYLICYSISGDTPGDAYSLEGVKCNRIITRIGVARSGFISRCPDAVELKE